MLFIDQSKSGGERLVALESIEPELLDESQIGRVLIALDKCLNDGEEPALQSAAFEATVRFAQICSHNFNNFAAPLLISALKLSLVEATEVAAQDLTHALTTHLPPSSLVDPVCSIIANEQDDELRNLGYTIAMQIPQLARRQLDVSSKDNFIFKSL